MEDRTSSDHLRATIATGLSAAFNLLFVLVVCFGLMPQMRREAEDLQRIAVESRDAAAKVQETLNVVAAKNLDRYLEAHRKTQEILDAVMKKLEGRK